MTLLDLNHGSGCLYGESSLDPIAPQINALIDAGLTAAERAQPKREYLGASRIGEPCARRLMFEYRRLPEDDGAAPDGLLCRVFAAGHVFEDLSINWLRQAGFDLRNRRRDGSPFGFSTAHGRIRGHIDGVIIGGPEIGISWPALWEHKALNAKSWNELVKHGLQAAKPVYYAQVQIYMDYLELETCLFTALNKNSQELAHEHVPFDAAIAQTLSDRAVMILRMADAEEWPPPISHDPDFYLCRFCPYRRRCQEMRP